MIIEQSKIFVNSKDQINSFLHKNDITNYVDLDLDTSTDISLYLNIDSEFNVASYDIPTQSVKNHFPVLVQVRNAHVPELAYCYKTVEVEEYILNNNLDINLYTEPTFTSNSIVDQFLTSSGYQAATIDHPENDEELPFLTVVLYAHFALVDIPNIFRNELLDSVYSWFENGELKHKKRTRISATQFQDYYKSTHIIAINDRKYRIIYKIVDSSMIAGVSTYDKLCTLNNIINKYKQLATKDKISNFLNWYITNPREAVKYAMGDLYVSDIVYNFNENMCKVYTDLNIPEYFNDVKLTIGSTVANLIKDVLSKSLETEDVTKDDRYKGSLINANPDNLSKLKHRDGKFLSKVFGGRCSCFAPLFTSETRNISSFVDIDIEGAYSRAMSQQALPIGDPVIISRCRKSRNKTYLTYNDFKKLTKNELVDTLWHVVFNAKNLSFDQDLIPSWTDYAESYHGIDPKSGENKIFKRDIINGVLTSDILQTINICFSERHKKDLFEKMQISAIAFYPKSLKTDFNKYKNDEFVPKRFAPKMPNNYIMEHAEYNNWTSINLGRLLINELVCNRKKYSKTDPEQAVFNGFYKLISNTVYGCLVSLFFKTTNAIVANNITARVRTGMYTAEKALGMFGTITDGQFVNLDRVFKNTFKYNRSSYYAEMFSLNYRELDDSKIARTGNIEKHEKLTDTELCEIFKNMIKEKFPISIWVDEFDINISENVYKRQQGLFDFTIKTRSNSLTTHGVSNYTTDVKCTDSLTYRSCKKRKEHQGYYLDKNNDTLIKNDLYKYYAPQQVLIQQIANNDRSCDILPSATVTAILKPDQFKNSKKLKQSGLIPSDTVIEIVTPKYCTLSRFKFLTYTQYKSWIRAQNTLIRKYNYGLELLFLNGTGNVDYKKMLESLYKAINDNVKNPLAHFDKNDHLARTLPDKIRDYKKCYDIIKSNYDNILIDNTDEFPESENDIFNDLDLEDL